MEFNWSVLGWYLVAVLILMTIGWLISLPARNVMVVDSLWGLGFVLTAWVTFTLADGWPGRWWLMRVLATPWGLRLCVYLSFRNWGKGEDPRYGNWREASGERHPTNQSAPDDRRRPINESEPPPDRHPPNLSEPSGVSHPQSESEP